MDSKINVDRRDALELDCAAFARFGMLHMTHFSMSNHWFPSWVSGKQVCTLLFQVGLAVPTLGAQQGCNRSTAPAALAPSPSPAPLSPTPKAAGVPAKAPVHAPEPPEPPMLVFASVTGVQASDTLNIRKTPSPSAEVLGKIPASEEKVACVGPHHVTGASRWMRVSYQGTQGWVNQRYLKFSGKARALEKSLECVGTEPFWSLQIDPSGLSTFEAMGASPKALLLKDKQQAVGRLDVWRLTFHGKDPELPSSLFLAKSDGCSDDMSDHRYAYELFVTLGSQSALKGCCDLAKTDLVAK